MVINNFYVVNISIFPNETDAPLVVDANAMLPISVTAKALQAITWWCRQVAQLDGGV